MRNDSELRGEMGWQEEDASAGTNLVLGSYALQTPFIHTETIPPTSGWRKVAGKTFTADGE